VIPDLLEVSPDTYKEVRKSLAQLAAMVLGAGLMLGISWGD